MKRLVNLILSLVLLFTTIFAMPAIADAASKPAATKIVSLEAGVKSFTVKWSKKEVDGYQVFYSTSSSFKSYKKITIRKASTTKKKISGLKSKTKYYVKVRTFKEVNGKNKKSEWSKVKAVTTKKESSKPSYGNIVYITPSGSKYHYSAECAGKNAIKTTLSEAKTSGYEPCKKCANG